MCGEQGAIQAAQPLFEGSSPRVRGAAISTQSALVDHGIIPACAGSSPHTTIYLRFCWDHPACAGSSWNCKQGYNDIRDHPRVCGEQWMAAARLPLMMGSSPRVRGAVRAAAAQYGADGIIPACAGSRT